MKNLELTIFRFFRLCKQCDGNKIISYDEQVIHLPKKILSPKPIGYRRIPKKWHYKKQLKGITHPLIPTSNYVNTMIVDEYENQPYYDPNDFKKGFYV